MNGERFERHRALVEDIAYSGMSAQEIAEKYGLSLEGIPQFSSTWAKDEVADLIR
jgi:transposase